MHVARFITQLGEIPVDFLADPDGIWDYEGLVRWAGLEQEGGSVAIGALSEPYAGFPEGSAVVASSGQGEAPILVALVDCTDVAGESARAAA